MIIGQDRNNYLKLLLALAISGLAQTVNASASIGETIGEAYDLATDELLYRETHCIDDDRDAREVIYQNSDGRLIARKLVDYSSGLTTPSFVQHNLYSREMIEVELVQGTLTMSVLEAGTPEPIKTTSTQPGDELPVVIDAGFDEFVRENWDSLVGGQTKRFLFPFAARTSLMELRIKPADCSYQTITDQCFRLELSNWFLRMLAAPIELGYDAAQRRLTRYRGLSNIGDGNGNGLVVDIRYNYQDIPELACRIPEQALSDNSDIGDISFLQNNSVSQ